MVVGNDEWWFDPMVWLGLLQGASIWAMMAIFLGPSSAWISLACGGMIGLFLYLVALGYQDYRFAKATVWGVIFNTILASISAIVAFAN